MGRLSSSTSGFFLSTTTPAGIELGQYLGVVNGEAIIGANIFRDMFASVRDVVGGRAGSYERVLAGARDAAVEALIESARELGANGVIGSHSVAKAAPDGYTLMLGYIATHRFAPFAWYRIGLGVAFVRAYQQAGLTKQIPLLSVSTTDGTTLPALKDSCAGMPCACKARRIALTGKLAKYADGAPAITGASIG